MSAYQSRKQWRRDSQVTSECRKPNSSCPRLLTLCPITRPLGLHLQRNTHLHGLNVLTCTGTIYNITRLCYTYETRRMSESPLSTNIRWPSGCIAVTLAIFWCDLKNYRPSAHQPQLYSVLVIIRDKKKNHEIQITGL